MPNYVIITDSTTDLPADLIKELDILVLPLSFTIDGNTYEDYSDGRDLPLKDFYNKVRAGKMSVTSQINPEDFIKAFEPILKNGNDILYIAFSSGLSGTYQSANIAADKLKELYPERKIAIVDSLCASMGEGLFVYYAVMKKREGMNINELEKWLNDNKLKFCHWFTVDDLHHLRRGGRVSAATAILGSMLSIKPVLHVDDEGHLILMGKSRGRRKSLDCLVSKFEEIAIDPKNQIVFISHGDCEDDANYVANEIKKKFNVKNVIISMIGPVIGSHSGPGTIALFFVGNKR